MKFARVTLAFTMLLAIVFRSLPDSVFDHFHRHDHFSADLNKHSSVGNLKHNCHIEDWNFESFEVTEDHYKSFEITAISPLVANPYELCQTSHVKGFGRAPPVI